MQQQKKKSYSLHSFPNFSCSKYQFVPPFTDYNWLISIADHTVWENS